MNYYCVFAMFISIFIATILVAPSTMANYIETGKLSILNFILTSSALMCATSCLTTSHKV